MIIVLRAEELEGDDQEPYRTYDISLDDPVAAVAKARDYMIDEFVLSEEPEIACIILDTSTVLLESDL
jgi:hypothetical protein